MKLKNASRRADDHSMGEQDRDAWLTSHYTGTGQPEQQTYKRRRIAPRAQRDQQPPAPPAPPRRRQDRPIPNRGTRPWAWRALDVIVVLAAVLWIVQRFVGR